MTFYIYQQKIKQVSTKYRMFNVPSILIVITSITLVGCAGVNSRNGLPTSVNSNGTAHYTEYKIDVKNNLIGFAGVGNAIELHDTGEIRTKVSINSESEFSMEIDYEFHF